jgi:chromosomal replication initiator protein
VSDNLLDLWPHALNRLEREIPTPSFEAWVRQAHPVGTQGDALLLGVPTPLAQETLQSRFTTLLERTLSDLAARAVGVRFVLDLASASRDHGEPDPRPIPAETPRSAPTDAALRDRYTFESFVVGNSNRLAHAAALAVAQGPARSYNPLFIYGGVGLGKTHLMHAIGHQTLARHRKLRVLYVPSETFTNEMINSIRDDKTAEFRARYRSIDVLLIDDIQFLSGKERTQEEFFHTFEALHGAQKQIVISSDRPPKEIPTLEERLRSRFEWGLITDIQPPDYETRIAILRKKAQSEDLYMPDAVLSYIARRIEANIRELEGALIRLAAYVSLHHLEPTQQLAEDTLKDLFPTERHREVTLPLIQSVVAEHYGLSAEELCAKTRTRAVAFPRQVAMYLSRRLTDASLPRIGDAFGGRDHTTVMHACDKISRALETDDRLRATIDHLSQTLLKT